MEDLSFVFSALSLIVLFLISSFVYLFSKRFKLPYTVLLVIVWLLLVPLSNTELFSFIDDFRLTPNILFFVFLPILLFESSYNIKYKHIIKDWKVISWLAIVWLIISAFIIAGLLYLLFSLAGFNIPFIVLLLFWSLISATDPVAVLAIFKTIWAPRRLALIFEWESLFNDWTAVALFLVILWVILEWWVVTTWTYFSWAGMFVSMLVGGILFWGFIGVVFSKILGYIRYNEEAEITITMLSAHFTFLTAELITHFFPILPISWVIATVVSGIVIWNYWKYKITPRVEAHMQKLWEFFAFLANSIVFILMWLTLSYINIDILYFMPAIILVIIVVWFARAASVYSVVWFFNSFKWAEKVPMNWQHLLSWWSLRGVLALIMVLMIPGAWDPDYDKIVAFQEIVWWGYSFTIKDFLLVLTVWSIMFTLFIKATTISLFMKKMNIDKLWDLEELEYEEGKVLTNVKIIEKLNNSYKRAYLSKFEYDELLQKYQNRLKNAIINIKVLLKGNNEHTIRLISKAISLHALWIEKKYLKQLYLYNEIDEKNFNYILWKIEKQSDRIESGSVQIRRISWEKYDYDIFTKLFLKFYKNVDSSVNIYVRNRAKEIITSKVIVELRYLQEIDFGFDNIYFQDIIELYNDFNRSAQKKKTMISLEIKATIMWLESRLVEKSLIKLEEKVIKDLYDKEIITPKIYIKFLEEVEEDMFTDVRKMG